jgi:hypothetical protein
MNPQPPYPYPSQPYYPPTRPAIPRPSCRLYSPFAVSIAAFLGFPIAGFILIGANYRALGRSGAAWLAWIGGFVFMGWLIAATYFAAWLIPPLLIGSLAAAATAGLAVILQGRIYAAHIRAGGLPGSGWKVAGTITATMASFFALLVGTNLVIQATEPAVVRVLVGDKITVYGLNGASESDARTAGQAVLIHPVFGKKAREMGVEKTSHGYVASFGVKEGAENKPSLIRVHQELLSLLNQRAPAQQPWTVTMVDRDLHVLKTFQ